MARSTNLEVLLSLNRNDFTIMLYRQRAKNNDDDMMVLVVVTRS